MATRTVTIASSVGLHARPAALFVEAATELRPRRRDRQARRGPGRRDEHPRRHGPRGQVRRGGRPDGRRRRRRRDARLARRAPLARPRRGVTSMAESETQPRRGTASVSARGRHTDRWCRSRHRSGRRPTRARSTTRRRRSPTCGRPSSRSPSRSRSGRRGSTTRPSRSSRRPPSSPATRASSRPRPRSSRPATAGRTPSRTPWRRMPPSSRRSAATSPSGWPTCVTSARARSQRCSGVPAPGVPAFTEPSVIVAEDLAPAETATLDRRLVVGIITEAGGRTSHTAILAAQMGIPAVVQLAGATEIAPGTPVALDGDTGEVTIDPDMALVTAQRRAGRPSGARRWPRLSGPGRTSDGHRGRAARQHRRRRGRRRRRRPGPRGRRALPHRVRLPLGDQGADGRGADRDLPRRLRAVRGTPRRRAHPRRRRRQAAEVRRPRAGGEPGPRACAACGSRPSGPTCSTPSSRRSPSPPARPAPTCASWRRWSPRRRRPRWFARRVRENGLPKAGVMIEVPGAALRAHDVLGEVDFGSLGTNDLAQYTMAADRMQGALSDLLDPWQPARARRRRARVRGRGHASTGRSASAASRPVTRCSRSSSSGSASRQLSMAPSKVPVVRLALSLHSVAECQPIAAAARGARTAVDALTAVREAARTELTDLL